MDEKLKSAKRQIKRLIISQQDIFEAANYAYQLLKHEYYEPDYLNRGDDFYNSDEETNMEALNTALIVAYSRPFLKSKGQDSATPSLPSKIIKSFDKSELELHNTILEKRNKAVAHSDADLYEANLSKSEYDGSVYPFIQFNFTQVFTKDELLMIQSIIEKLLEGLGKAVASIFDHHGENARKYLVEK